MYCPGKSGARNCGRILEDISACEDSCAKVVNGS